MKGHKTQDGGREGGLFLPIFAQSLASQLAPARIEEALAAMRPPAATMTAETMRLAKVTPFSFARGLVDRMCRERWSMERVLCRVEADGSGLIVYRIHTRGRTLTFATRTVPFVDTERSGRLRDNEFDFYSALFDGEVDLTRIEAESDEQVRMAWRGRTDNTSLGWTFANRSNRLFDMVVDALAQGRQPDIESIASSGYIIRNAGFYGNGRHGCRNWQAFGVNYPLSEPYHVDLFCLYMWRQIGFDFVEEMANARSAKAVKLAPEIKRYLGVGNSSGIGMVAVLIRWPNWVSGYSFTREFTLALALTDRERQAQALQTIVDLSACASGYYRETYKAVSPTIEDRVRIADELQAASDLARRILEHGCDVSLPLVAFLSRVREQFSAETAEQIASLVIQSRPDLVELTRPLISSAMSLTRDIQPEMSIAALRSSIRRVYDWALDLDLARPGARRYFWYRSEENGENRRGERDIDSGVEFETFIDVAGSVQGLFKRLSSAPSEWSVARYLIEEPGDVYPISRVQFVSGLPYAEVRGNVIDEEFMPSNLIRYYLTMLGMETTNPEGARWVRGVFLQGAPLADELTPSFEWVLPLRPDNDQRVLARA